MQQAVADGVGDGGVSELVVPEFRVELTGDDSGGVAMPVIDNSEQVATLSLVERSEPPVIEHQHIYF